MLGTLMLVLFLCLFATVPIALSLGISTLGVFATQFPSSNGDATAFRKRKPLSITRISCSLPRLTAWKTARPTKLRQ